MNFIVSGRYCGPEPALRGKRGILMTNTRKALSEDSEPSAMVLVQWDDLDLWQETVHETGQGWEPYRFDEFDNFRFQTFEDESLL